MDFKIVKKGYDVEQVNNYSVEVKKVYEEALKNQKDRIFELKNLLVKAEAEIKNYQEKSSLIAEAILNAGAKAEEIEKLSKIKYSQEMEQLNAFHDRWINYYNNILGKYPLDDKLTSANKFNRQIGKVLQRVSNGEDSIKIIEEIMSEKTFIKETERLANTAVKPDVLNNNSTENPQTNESNNPGESQKTSENHQPNEAFNPIECISKYFTAQKNQDKSQELAASDTYPDRSASGFSLQECLNPKEDLSQIMKDLGLLTE